MLARCFELNVHQIIMLTVELTMILSAKCNVNCVKLTTMLRDQLKKHLLCFEVLIENSNLLLNNSIIVSLQSCEVTFTIEKI